MLSTWREAPMPVKWISFLFFWIGIGGIILALYALATFLKLPITGMTDLVVIQTSLQITVSSIIALASWRLLLRASWSRIVLEITAWAALVYYVGFDIVWIGSALTNWSEFKTEIAADVPHVSMGLKMAAVVASATIFVAVSVVVIRALRSDATRRYIKQSRNN